MEKLAEATGGESFRAHKYNLDLVNERPSIEYGEDKQLSCNARGETNPSRNYSSLVEKSRQMIRLGVQYLTYFLDGSRRVFKVDDIAYGKSGGRKIFYPVIAGQVGIACCRRRNKKLVPEKFDRRFLLALPDIADANRLSGFWAACTKKLNDVDALRRLDIRFEEILRYNTSRDEKKFEDRAVAQIMSFMNKREQETVAELVRDGKLNQNNYLVKDGSLEYLPLDKKADKQAIRRFKNNYCWVLGVSKTFNPDACLDARKKANHGFIAELPLHHRTPAICFENRDLFGDAKFAVWYIRLRDKLRTPFDGVIKVEKMLVTEEELKYGMNSEAIDMLSALLINERNPVCYGSDLRWANHLYPIYLTEMFIKSKYISTSGFLQLF